MEATAPVVESTFHGFDIFMILFMFLTAYGLFRAYRQKNTFAVLFCSVTLLTFMFANTVMVLHWTGRLDEVLTRIGIG